VTALTSPARGQREFAGIFCGTWGLVGVELDHPVLTEGSRAANFTNERGVDGTMHERRLQSGGEDEQGDRVDRGRAKFDRMTGLPGSPTSSGLRTL